MPKPSVPKDWLRGGFRWASQVRGIEPSRRFLSVEEMPGYETASAVERSLWASYRRASLVQEQVCMEVLARMPRLGYRARKELAFNNEAPDLERQTTMGVSSVINVLSGQRLMTLRDIAQFEVILDGPILAVMTLHSEAETGVASEPVQSTQTRAPGVRR